MPIQTNSALVYAHDITPGLVYKLNKFDCVSLDDSLFSHYYYIDLFKQPPIVGITTSYLVQSDTLRKRYVQTHKELDYYKPYDYMKMYFETNMTPFMTIAELEWLIKTEKAIPAFHSHFHDIIPISVTTKKRENKSLWTKNRLGIVEPIFGYFYLEWRSKLAYPGFEINVKGHKLDVTRRTEKDLIDFICHDTELGLSLFKDLGLPKPEIYIFPFNDESEILIRQLRKFGFKYFLGQNRREIGI